MLRAKNLYIRIINKLLHDKFSENTNKDNSNLKYGLYLTDKSQNSVRTIFCIIHNDIYSKSD